MTSRGRTSGSLPHKLKLGVASVAAVAMASVALPAATAARPMSTGTPETVAVKVDTSKRGSITSRVFGTFGKNGTVRGHFMPERFITKKGETYAQGVLSAKLRRGDGTLVGKTSREVTIPLERGSVEEARATCQILHLVLGPLNLNLLGLKVHLNRVVLDITAESGPGNLLGNLLCAIAGLLDGTGILQLLRLSNLLNRVLGLVA